MTARVGEFTGAFAGSQSGAAQLGQSVAGSFAGAGSLSANLFVAPSAVYFTGLETGDASEMASLGAGASIQGTTVRTGAYALKQAATASNYKNGLAATQSVVRVYFQFPVLPGSNQGFLQSATATPTVRPAVLLSPSGNVIINDATGTMGLTLATGTAVLSPGVWYRIEVAIDLAAGGIVRSWVNGTLDIDTTHSSDVSATPMDSWRAVAPASPNEYFFDDIRIGVGVLTPPGEGNVIARQGLAGTPTYDAWIKTGAATAALCWSDTPFNATTNCNSVVNAAAQTMLVAPFHTTQSGHGIGIFGPGATVNIAHVALIGKDGTAGAGTIRRRLGSADTDTAITWTTSDAYYNDGIWKDSAANLDAMEAGGVADLTNLTTVEDVWVMADYTPIYLTASFSGAGGLTVTAQALDAVGATLAGSGSVTVSVLSGPIDTAENFTGTGSLTAVVRLNEAVNAGPAGAGALVAGLNQTLAISATFAGAGSLAAAVASGPILSAENFAGAGGLAAAAQLAEALNANLTGAGALVAPVQQFDAVSGSLSGAGALAADVLSGPVLSAETMAGAGSLTADTELAEAIELGFAGAGALAGDVTVTGGATEWQVSANFAALGSLGASAEIGAAIQAVLAGAGTVYANVTSGIVPTTWQVSAAFDGVGALTAGPVVYIPSLHRHPGVPDPFGPATTRGAVPIPDAGGPRTSRRFDLSPRDPDTSRSGSAVPDPSGPVTPRSAGPVLQARTSR